MARKTNNIPPKLQEIRKRKYNINEMIEHLNEIKIFLFDLDYREEYLTDVDELVEILTEERDMSITEDVFTVMGYPTPSTL